MIVLYSTNCPKCKVLSMKLDGKNVKYKVVTDVDAMVDKGIKSAPCLEVDGEILGFSEAVKWVNESEEWVDE